MFTIKRILCPVDCSESSRAALDYALYLGEKFDAQIELLHAWHVTYHVRPDLSVWMQSHGQRPIADVVAAEAKAETEQFIAPLSDEAKKRLQIRVIEGDPAPTIVKTADDEKCDLIVMGTHGRSGLSHLALGSVAEKVVRRAHCPVLSVRQKTE